MKKRPNHYFLPIAMLFLSMQMLFATEHKISSISALEALANSLQAGDTVILQNGEYKDIGDVRIHNLQGTAASPIVIKSETLYGATISGISTLRFRDSDYLIIEGLRFEGIVKSDGFNGTWRVLNLQECNHTTVRRCSFINIGDENATSTYANLLRFDVDRKNDPERDAYNVVEYCLFQNLPACVALTLVVSDNKTNIGQNTIRNNVFRDTDFILNNGGEAVVIYAQGKQEDNPGHATIEGNVFDAWNGDGEIISVKSGRNLFKHNVFINTGKSAGCLSLRREKGNVVESNFFINMRLGLWAFGSDHIIRNNVFKDMYHEAIYLTAGGNLTSGVPVFETASNNLFANNTFIGTESNFVRFVFKEPFDEVRPHGNRFINNVFTSSTGQHVFRVNFGAAEGQTPDIDNNTFSNNLYWQDGGNINIPDYGTDDATANPLLAEGDNLFALFDEGSPALGMGKVLPEVTHDFFGNERTGNDLGHAAYPVDTSNYAMPFMFFPPDTAGFLEKEIEAGFDVFPKAPKKDGIVLLDARESTGKFEKYNWVVNGEASGGIDESVYSFAFEAAERYTIELQLLDGSGNVLSSETKAIGQAAGAENSMPTDVSLDKTAIDENVPIGTVVGTLTTVDADANDTHTYTLSGVDSDSFNISGASLTTAVAIDYEQKASYAITVTTNDGRGGMFSKNFTITINDLDEVVLGVAQKKDFDLRIYPNPAKDIFIIESEKQVTGVKLVDIRGNVIKTYQPQASYKLTAIKQGAYFVIASTTAGEKAVKLMVE